MGDNRTDNKALLGARWYAATGWPVVALHAAKDGQCSCGNSECSSPGKHPRYHKQLLASGLNCATRSEDTTRVWWELWPDANVGLATGEVSGIIALDIDPRNGGGENLARLEANHERLPNTVEVLTGGGGRHFFFKHPGFRVKCRCGDSALAPGVEVKGDGGYVVAPPSVHASGTAYAFHDARRPDRIGCADLPEWLRQLLSSERPGKHAAVHGERIADGERNNTLTSLAGSMRRQGISENAMAAALLEENRSRCDPPLSEREVTKIAKSVARYAPDDTSITIEPRKADTPDWPGPMAEEAFHGVAGDIVRIIEPHTEADPVAILVQILLAFGNLIGRSARFCVEADHHYTNEFAVFAGESSKGRKGTSLGQALRPLSLIDDVWAESRVIKGGLSSGEGLIWHVRDPIEKWERNRKTKEMEEVLADPGVEDKRLLMVEAEFASVLRVMHREGNTLSPVIRNAWDRGDLQTLTKNSPAKATGAHVTIVGHITVEELRRYLDRSEAANGFGNRFLWLCVKRSKLLPEGGQLSLGELDPFVSRLRAAVEFSKHVAEVQRDDETREVWREVYAQLSVARPGMFGAVTSRSEAHVLRLSMLYALLDRSAIIRKEHLLAALAVWEYAESSARFIFGDALGNPVADEILRALKNNPEGLTRTDIRNLFQRNKDSGTVSQAVSLLISHGLVYQKKEETGGRPTERLFARSVARVSTT